MKLELNTQGNCLGRFFSPTCVGIFGLRDVGCCFGKEDEDPNVNALTTLYRAMQDRKMIFCSNMIAHVKGNSTNGINHNLFDVRIKVDR